MPPSLVALQQQVVGKSDPTAVFARTDVLLNKNNTLNLQFDYNRIHATNVDDGSTRSIAPIANASLLTGTSYWVRGNLTTVFSEHADKSGDGAMGAGSAHHGAELHDAGIRH